MESHMESAQNIVRQHNQQCIDIAFKDIVYEVPLKVKKTNIESVNSPVNKTKTILHGVSGIFKGGEIAAIMGSSGAGKTTLLNIISGRVASFKGQLYANQKPYTSESFGDFANYVMQHDVLMQTLTVRETLQFSARLKTNDQSKVQQKISSWSKKLKLQKCLDVLVGGPLLKGISGGQKKRTSIAFQLMSDPQVVALDQPTSGMDSLTSYIIINALKALANQGKTIFLTIHQPNSQIFQLFDKLLLMVEGHIIYQGRIENAQAYFKQYFHLECPVMMNPADYYIKILHHEQKQNVQRYPQYYRCYNETMAISTDKDIDTRSKDQLQIRKVEVSNFHSLGQLVKRDVLNSMRNPLIIRSRCIQMLIIALFTGGLYFNAGGKDYTDTVNWNTISGYIFFMSIAIVTESKTSVALVFPQERNVFLKEQNSKMYGVFSYFLSRNVVQIPFTFIVPAIYQLIVYWMIGLGDTAGQFFTMYFILVLEAFMGTSLGLFVGSIITDSKGISGAVTVMLLPFIVLAGFFKNPANMSHWFGWIQYISPFKYGFIGLLNNEVGSKASLIDNFNFDFDMWPAIMMLLALGVAMRIIALYVLWAKKGKLQ